jgi:predicted nucleotide-binding protein
MVADFPRLSLEQALELPNALLRNGGQPLTSIDLATAINRSPGSSYIRTLGTAAIAYGLTGGSYKSTFKMESGGEAIVSPRSPDERAASLVAAALRPTVFRKVFDYYKGKKFPEQQFFINTVIREFEVDPKQAQSFYETFSANVRFVGLVRATPGGDWLTSEANAGPPEPIPADVPADDASDPTTAEDISDARPAGSNLQTTDAPPQRKRRPNKLFVGHGRNKKPVDQLTKLLRDLGIPYLVAEDEPNAGRPISKKVRDTMDQCGAAVLVFTADVEYFDKDGNPIWRPSENVSHELGASAVLYDDRIIMFKEESVDLASNFSGIGYIPFEKDKLDAKMNDLLRELVALKILRLSVGGDE